MTPEAFRETARELSSRQPFRRYRIHLVHGLELTIEHPDLLSWAGESAVITGMDRNGREFRFEADTVSCVEQPSETPRRERRKR